MKIIHYTRFGQPEQVLALTERDLPQPGAGEVRIRLEAAPVHLADLKHIHGLPWFDQYTPPYTPGYEGVGRISALGPGVTTLHIGERVFLPIRFGAWQEELIAPAAGLWRAPEAVPGEQLALVPINFSTAYLMLRTLVTLEPGEWVIQNAANSNVGYYLIRLARRWGLRTVNVVRREQHLPLLQSAGGDVNLVDGPDLAERVKPALQNGRLRLAIDAIAGDAPTRLARCLETGGVVANYGILSGVPCQIPGEMLFLDDITLRGFWTARAVQQIGPERTAAMQHDIFNYLVEDPPAAPIAGIYHLHEVRQAVAHAARVGSERPGKIVLIP
jgi:mitochondrial enoyl-[acyl-carrier protein] reductase / trans-2-enoyl-CoA reductase